MIERRTYLGKGKVYMRDLTGGGLLPVGGVSKLELSIETDKKELPNFQTSAGGNVNEISRVKSVGVAITMQEFTAENLVKAIRGTLSQEVAGTVTDERHTATKGGLIILAKMPDRSVDPVVTVDPDGSPDIKVKGVDYEFTPSGITILEDGSITTDDILGIAYSTVKMDVIEALTNSGGEYELFFDGLNEAESDAPVNMLLYKTKFSPTSGLGLIGEDFGELELDGSLLVDTSKTGTGISQFFKATFAA
jgi:hypothetical protein